MLTGQPPFASNNRKRTMEKVSRGVAAKFLCSYRTIIPHHLSYSFSFDMADPKGQGHLSNLFNYTGQGKRTTFVHCFPLDGL